MTVSTLRYYQEPVSVINGEVEVVEHVACSVGVTVVSFSPYYDIFIPFYNNLTTLGLINRIILRF